MHVIKQSDKKKDFVGYIFILPAILFLIIFVGYPILYNIIMSFYKVDLKSLNTGISEFIGFNNYRTLFAFGTNTFKVIYNTFFFTVMCLILQFSIGFILALFFNNNFQFAKTIRGLIMVAWLVPVTVTALNFKFMFSERGGIINFILLSLGFIDTPIAWLVGQQSAMWSVIITNVWIGIPFNMILLVTGLTTISNTLYESSNIDGANWIQKLCYITIPSIKTAIFSCLTLGFINTFKIFDLIFMMTNGGPVDATEVLSTLSYRFSFDKFNYSMGATVADILFIILLLVCFIYIRGIKEDEVM